MTDRFGISLLLIFSALVIGMIYLAGTRAVKSVEDDSRAECSAHRDALCPSAALKMRTTEVGTITGCGKVWICTRPSLGHATITGGGK